MIIETESIDWDTGAGDGDAGGVAEFARGRALGAEGRNEHVRGFLRQRHQGHPQQRQQPADGGQNNENKDAFAFHAPGMPPLYSRYQNSYFPVSLKR